MRQFALTPAAGKRLVQGDLVAAAGVCGAEGAVWLAVRNFSEEVRKAADLVSAVHQEPPFTG